MADKPKENKEEEKDEKKCHVSVQDNENLNDMSIWKIANCKKERERENFAYKIIIHY